MNTVELARAAGVHPLAYSEEYIGGLERLVAAAVAAEREACAKVCEEVERKATKQPPMVGQGCQACAAAIRARSKE